VDYSLDATFDEAGETVKPRRARDIGAHAFSARPPTHSLDHGGPARGGARVTGHDLEYPRSQ
jgi:hypothetical protein